MVANENIPMEEYHDCCQLWAVQFLQSKDEWPSAYLAGYIGHYDSQRFQQLLEIRHVNTTCPNTPSPQLRPRKRDLAPSGKGASFEKRA